MTDPTEANSDKLSCAMAQILGARYCCAARPFRTGLSLATNRILLAGEAAREIQRSFVGYNRSFRQLTQNTQRLFEGRQWSSWQSNATARIDLYHEHILETVRKLEHRLGPLAYDAAFWTLVKTMFAEITDGEIDRELFRTFFNSLTRYFFKTIGVNSTLEFVDIETGPLDRVTGLPPTRRYVLAKPVRAARRLMFDFAFLAPWAGSALGERRLAEQLEHSAADFVELELLVTPFFRQSRCFLVGRLCGSKREMPVMIALVHSDHGIEIDAWITSIDTISILFGFTRSYFHVDVDPVAPTVAYLRSILPHKAASELFTVVGRAKQGKTERYRALFRHLRASRDLFVTADGAKGMVMIVFTLPSHDLVFKVIRDRFAYPKTVKRAQVLDSYSQVFRHDRVGRLVDAQEFRRLRFRLDRFDDEIREELLTEAASSVEEVGDHIIIRHLYMERRLRPLNLYLNEANPEEALAAVIDYGQAVRDLAQYNIFPGDLLLKNFGVTRHGRVVFYDYDEVCAVTDCNFRALPAPRDELESLSEETWFEVGPHDVFPEQFPAFIGLDGELRQRFMQYHGELMTLRYWQQLKDQLLKGKQPDVPPYRNGFSAAITHRA